MRSNDYMTSRLRLHNYVSYERGNYTICMLCKVYTYVDHYKDTLYILLFANFEITCMQVYIKRSCLAIVLFAMIKILHY